MTGSAILAYPEGRPAAVAALRRSLQPQVSDEQLERTVSYYLAWTSHGSTLSGVVIAWVLARYEPEEAWRFLQHALESDVADVQGGTTAEGIHLGAMAGRSTSCCAAWPACGPGGRCSASTRPCRPRSSRSASASFGFNFSCEDKGGLNPPTGQLRLQLSYTDQGTSQLLGAPFSIQGTADELDPVVESALCIDQNSPPGGNELIFLGRFRLTSSPPPGFPQSCPSSETSTSPLCRFEVIVRDTDGNLVGSKGDFFSIKLSSDTAVTSELDPATVFYARAGYLV